MCAYKINGYLNMNRDDLWTIFQILNQGQEAECAAYYHLTNKDPNKQEGLLHTQMESYDSGSEGQVKLG